MCEGGGAHRWPRGCVKSLVSMMVALRVSRRNGPPVEGHGADKQLGGQKSHVHEFCPNTRPPLFAGDKRQ